MTLTSFSLQRIPDPWRAYLELTRVDKPIGSLLLLWPVLSALWLASEGLPDTSLLMIFIAGTLLTRAAGCAVNDFADRHFDGQVARTQARPLVTQRITSKAALILAAILFFLAFILVTMTNRLTVLLAAVGLLIACCYPFVKRFSNYPQVVLAVAFSWGVPMAFSAVTGELPTLTGWWLFIATLLWVMVYDTEYAMVDREDDLKIGVKSTAIAFGRYDRLWIGLFQVATLGGLGLLWLLAGLGYLYLLSLLVVTGLFAHQQRLISKREADQCFFAFRQNNLVGLALFCGIALDPIL